MDLQILRGAINSQPQKHMSKTWTPWYLGQRNGPNAKTTTFDSGKEINIQDRCRKWAGSETKTLYILTLSAKSALSLFLRCLLTWCDSFDSRLWHLHPRNQKCNSLRESGVEKITGVLRGGKNCPASGVQQPESVDVHREGPLVVLSGIAHTQRLEDQSDGDGVGYGYRGGKTIPTFLCRRSGSEQTRADCTAAELGRPK